MVRSILAGVALACMPIAAQAVTYDVVTGFGTGPFSYGSTNGGTGFVALPNFSSNCENAGYACYFSQNYQQVGNPTANGTVYGTVGLLADRLLLHPENGTATPDTAVRFTAPTTSTYSVSGLFSRLSLDPSGDGVNVAIYRDAALIFSSALLAGNGLPNGATVNFSEVVALGQGQTLSFVVNRNGDYGYDSTGLAASIAAVPEPAAWAMMIGGFGLVGGALRSRRSLATA